MIFLKTVVDEDDPALAIGDDEAFPKRGDDAVELVRPARDLGEELLDPRRHGVERVAQVPELVPMAENDAGLEPALGHGPGADGQAADRPGDPDGQEEGQDQGGERRRSGRSARSSSASRPRRTSMVFMK